MLDTTTEIHHRLGARVCARRAELGLTQHALAVRASISRPSIANVEAGRQNVGLRQLASLARALDVQIDVLLRPRARGSASASARFQSRKMSSPSGVPGDIA